jgi:hypothetical protein
MIRLELVERRDDKADFVAIPFEEKRESPR